MTLIAIMLTVVTLSLLASVTTAFTSLEPIQQRPWCTLHARSNPNLPTDNTPNEFSRTLQPDRILRTKKDYNMNLEASVDECKALADRFDLSNIANLHASVCLRREVITGRSKGIQVEGTITATVTQTCVRTNEDFSVDIEFPLYSIVRPVLPLYAQQQRNNNNNSKQNTKSPRKGSSTRLGDFDLADLERILQDDILAEDDALMEDESIYPVDGLFDVGELVAQLFWLKLDPYPKKPGSKFVQRSITG